MKTYIVKLLLEEVEVIDTPWGHASMANTTIKQIKQMVDEANYSVNKAISYTNRIRKVRKG